MFLLFSQVISTHLNRIVELFTQRVKIGRTKCILLVFIRMLLMYGKECGDLSAVVCCLSILKYKILFWE